MTIKLIALDLDGTLLNSQKQISEGNKLALAAARAQGVKVIVTTGRPLAAVEAYLQDLDLIDDEEYAITFNGGLIQQNTGKILDKTVFGYQEVQEIYGLTQQLGLPLDLVDGGDVYALTSRVETLYPTCNAMLNHMPTDFEAIAPDQVFNKAITSCAADLIDTNLAKIPADFHDRFEIFKSRDIILEWNPKGVQKANGLSNLIRHLGIKQEDVMACGDEANDRSMIEWAGVSVAVANATDEIKELAQIVTPMTNDQDAIAWVINEYVLRKD